MGFWLKKYLSKRYGTRKLLHEWKLESIDSLLKRESERPVLLSGNHAALDRVRRVAVEGFVPSEEDKPKRHQSAREISCETSILCSSVHMIIHHNLQLKCFKRCRAQLFSEANRISRLTH